MIKNIKRIISYLSALALCSMLIPAGSLAVDNYSKHLDFASTEDAEFSYNEGKNETNMSFSFEELDGNTVEVYSQNLATSESLTSFSIIPKNAELIKSVIRAGIGVKENNPDSFGIRLMFAAQSGAVIKSQVVKNYT